MKEFEMQEILDRLEDEGCLTSFLYFLVERDNSIVARVIQTLVDVKNSELEEQSRC
jgi:hypothetical protein